MPYDWTSNYVSATDANLYAIYRSVSTGYVWNGTAMVAWVDGDIAGYDVPSTWAGGDLYGHTVPTSLPTGDTYTGLAYIRAGATPAITDTKLPDEFDFRWNGSASVSPGPGAADWYYSNQTSLTDMLASENLAILSDEENTGAINTARVQRAGEWSDAYIDAILARCFTVPLAGLSAASALILGDISNELTAWKLNRYRAIQSIGNQPVNANTIDAIMAFNRRNADETLAKILSGDMTISTTSSQCDPKHTPGALTFIAVSECELDDEYAH